MKNIPEKQLLLNVDFSIIIPWYGGNTQREESLTNMLKCLTVQKIPANKEPIIFEVIIVEQIKEGDEEFRKNKIYEIVPSQITDFTYIQIKKDGLFNKSWCMNVGARQAKQHHLLFMDADSLFGEDYFTTMKYQIRCTPHPRNKVMFCWNYIICLMGKDNPIVRHIRPDMTCAMGGIWYAEKYFYFNNFGGMNESFEGYGGEDNDAYERVLFALNVPSVSYMPYPLAHQYHHWEKPSENCSKYFEITKKHPKIIIERLKKAEIGKFDRPTIIEMEI